MYRPEKNILSNALFFEALSGEFTPPSDAQNRAHTLGHLAIATYTKGEQTVSGQSPKHNHVYSVFKYSPSWAPNVTAEVHGYNIDPFGSLTSDYLLLNKIYLENNTNKTFLDVLNSETVWQPKIFLDNGSGEIHRFILGLGQKLDNAKHKTTALAQQFFESDTN